MPVYGLFRDEGVQLLKNRIKKELPNIKLYEEYVENQTMNCFSLIYKIDEFTIKIINDRNYMEVIIEYLDERDLLVHSVHFNEEGIEVIIQSLIKLF